MDVQQYEIQHFEKESLLCGVDIKVMPDENEFTDEGDTHLFSETPNRFLALYADIRLSDQLTLIIRPVRRSLRWRKNHNQRLSGY